MEEGILTMGDGSVWTLDGLNDCDTTTKKKTKPTTKNEQYMNTNE